MVMLIFDLHTCWSRNKADKGFKGLGTREQFLLKVKTECKRINS